jgi:DNA adenine methylase
MRYLGGKSKIRKEVSSFLESIRNPNQVYLEPFVGGGWILQEMSGERIGSDGNIVLIEMYKALQNGWIPPNEVSEELYRKYLIKKHLPDNYDPLTAFIGFGCSFGGKWYGGYARPRNYALECKSTLLKQLPLIKDVLFKGCDFTSHTPNNQLVYCDPPYQNTTSYGAFKGFDHDKFWDVMREWSLTNTVVISEYKAPSDFICVREFFSKMGLSSNTENGGKQQELRSEKLFMHESQAYLATPKVNSLLVF